MANAITCSVAECDQSIPNHKWGKIQADDWFHLMDGRSYCPDHIPDWVEVWRAHQKLQKAEREEVKKLITGQGQSK